MKNRQPALDLAPQEGFTFAPMDLGTTAPAECSRGHEIPSEYLSCPICLDFEKEKLARALHDRVVAAAIAAIRNGDDSTRVIIVSVAGYPHISPKDKWEIALCGERINPARQMSRKLAELKANASMYCKACRAAVGL